MSTTLAPFPSLSPFDSDVPGLNAFLGDLTAMRNYCMANDVFVSISMEAQRPAKDWFKDLFKASNCAPVFSEGVLKAIPWSEVSQVANGTIFTAPTANGPVFDLTTDHFIVKDAGAPPLKITRPRLFDVPNVISVQYVNRDSEYNDGTVMASDTGLIAQYGPIRSQPEKIEWVHDTALAQRVAYLLLWAGDPTSSSGGGTISRLRYQFVLPQHFAWLEPMDLVTVTDISQRVYRRPVRMLTLKEQDDMTLECEAEDFIYGSHALPGPPISASVLPTSGTGVGLGNALPGPVNPPIIFEPVPAFDPQANGNIRIYIAVSGEGANYGGCHVQMSSDGGNSYQSQGAVIGSAVMGVSLADFPLHADPDTVDPLTVNLVESGGVLSSITQAQTDLFQNLSYIAGGGAATVNGQSATVT